jgi:hypothetical protein
MHSVFAAVNEQRVAEEAIGVKHCREDYLKFLDAPPGNLVIALQANGHHHWLVDEIQRTWSPDRDGPCSTRLRPPNVRPDAEISHPGQRWTFSREAQKPRHPTDFAGLLCE